MTTTTGQDGGGGQHSRSRGHNKDDVVLSVEGLKCYFKTDEGVVRAVDGVSYALRRSEVLGVVGESGSGKSVTQLAIMGLIPMPPGLIAGGQARFEGRDLLKLSQGELRKLRGNKLSMIFQDPMTSLNPFLRISRQLEEVLEIHTDLSREDRRARGIAMLETVGIPDAKGRYDQYP
ncbi:MAG: ATP-binding cassette domain-containing protein, partial [Myxococcota bacterium]